MVLNHFGLRTFGEVGRIMSRKGINDEAYDVKRQVESIEYCGHEFVMRVILIRCLVYSFIHDCLCIIQAA
jgi:hypothetical protein